MEKNRELSCDDCVSHGKTIDAKCIFSYIIAAVLLCFYLYVLNLGLHPRVSYEYRGFYIDHKLKYMPREGSLEARPGVKLMLDGKDDSDNTFYGIGRGWAWDYTGKAMENSGYCYTASRDNYLYFTGVDLSKPHTLWLHIKNPGVAPAEVRVNGGVVSGTVAADEETVVIDIPAGPVDGREGTGYNETDDINECEIDIVIEDGERMEVDYLIFDP